MSKFPKGLSDVSIEWRIFKVDCVKRSKFDCKTRKCSEGFCLTS